MKFTKSTRLIFAMVFIYLTAFAELAQIESSIKLNLKARKNNISAENHFKNSFRNTRTLIKSRSGSSNNKDNSEIRQNCAKIYQDCNFQGESLLVCDDISRYNSNWSKKASSIKVGPNTKMIVFTKANYEGNVLEIIGENSCLVNQNFNDMIVSHRMVTKNCAVLFKHCNYGGSSHKLCDSISNLSDDWKGGDLSSIIVGLETKITLFSQRQFKGEKMEITQNNKCLGNFNDKTNSVQILGGSKSVDIIKTNNVWGNLAIGFFEGLAGNETSFYKCFPREWKSSVNPEETKANALDESFKSWNEGIQSFLNAGKTIINLFCKQRRRILRFISAAVSLSKLKSNKKFRMQKESNSNVSSLGRNSVTYQLMRVSKNKMLVIQSGLSLILKTWFNLVKAKVIGFINKIIDFFKSDTFKKIVTISKCILGGFGTAVSFGTAVYNIYNTIMGFYRKINILIAAAPTVVLFIIIVVDYAIALLCNWKKFKTGVNYFLNAWNQGNKSLKFLFYGKALGTFLNAIGSASTFSEQYQRIQESISKPKPKS